MKYLRNREVKRMICTSAAFTILFAGAAVSFSPVYAIYVFCMGIVLTLIFLLFTISRYKRIDEMSAMTDRILHGEKELKFSDYSEGELAVLQSEICKLTVRLTEQADKLKNEKVYLADSISDISHQIRTPLTSLNIFVSMLSESGIPEEKKSEMLTQMQRLLAKIEWQINALLKISKLDAGTVHLEKNSVSVKELIIKVLSVIAVPMDIKNQTVTVACSENASFCGDALWTNEALVNILKNCSEHTPECGIIHIEAQENSIYTEIKISDSGSGIAAEDLPHIFERFYKGKDSSEQSVGIGLALAQMIIASQNGTVKAENGIGGGAVFTVKFYKAVV